MKTKNMVSCSCNICKRRIHFHPADKIMVLKIHMELFHPDEAFYIPLENRKG